MWWFKDVCRSTASSSPISKWTRSGQVRSIYLFICISVFPDNRSSPLLSPSRCDLPPPPTNFFLSAMSSICLHNKHYWHYKRSLSTFDGNARAYIYIRAHTSSIVVHTRIPFAHKFFLLLSPSPGMREET